MTTKSDELVPESVRLLADACTLHFRTASRLWTLAGAVVLVAVAGEGKLFGVEFRKEVLYPVASAVLAGVTVAYCSSHLMSYRVALMMHDLLSKLRSEKKFVTPNFTEADVAHALYGSTLNRVHPFSQFLPKRISKPAYRIFKPVVDLFFYLTPAVGFFLCLGNTQLNPHPQLHGIVMPAVWILAFITVIATFTLEVVAILWAVKGPEWMAERFGSRR